VLPLSMPLWGLMVDSFILYNPQSATAPERLDTISSEFKKVDVIGLIGAGQWCSNYEGPVSRVPRAHHLEVSFLWKKSRFTNKSTGISVMLGRRFRDLIVRVWTPPGHLAGRVAALRCRSRGFDQTFRLWYFLPRSSLSEDARIKCTEEMLGWFSGVAKEVPSRSILVGLDDTAEAAAAAEQRPNKSGRKGSLPGATPMDEEEEDEVEKHVDFLTATELEGVTHRGVELAFRLRVAIRLAAEKSGGVVASSARLLRARWREP